MPLAAETLGVRSMAVAVETPDAKMLIDPGVSLAPKRYGLAPTGAELGRERELWSSVKAHTLKSDIVIISHYHYDHHNPESPGIFRGKNLAIKHPLDNINRSQRKRSSDFLEALGNLPASVEYADGREFDFGNTALRFSPAVPHGTDARLGYVVESVVSHGKDVFLHTSDVEGPSLDSQVGFILECQPTVVACDGPMTYLMYKYGNKAMGRSLANLGRIMREAPVKTLILDHHLARDLNWREKVAPVFAAGEECGCRVTSFAGYLGRKDELLEARRKELAGNQ